MAKTTYFFGFATKKFTLVTNDFVNQKPIQQTSYDSQLKRIQINWHVILVINTKLILNKETVAN